MNATVHDCEQHSTWVKNEEKRAFLGVEEKSSISRIMSVAYPPLVSLVMQYPEYQKTAQGIFSSGRVMQESL